MKLLVINDAKGLGGGKLTDRLARCPNVEMTSVRGQQEARRAVSGAEFHASFVEVHTAADRLCASTLQLIRELWTEHRTPAVAVADQWAMDGIRLAMRHNAYAVARRAELEGDFLLTLLDELRHGARVSPQVSSSPLLGSSPAISRLRESLARVARSRRPILVTGPTGAGKELVVREIHRLGCNPDQQLLDLNCGALPLHLVESQLFGHARGAFTGADRTSKGHFTTVGRGLLFLDEVAELSLELQVKLLRVLESNTYRPIGSAEELKFQGRVVAATHADLAKRVRAGTFREDLYYRINVLEVTVPGLQERREDIPLLAAHFAAQQEAPLHLKASALEYLQAREWPGNVRQLRNLLDRAAVFGDGQPICADALRRVDRRAQAGEGDAGRTALDHLASQALAMDCSDKLQSLEEVLITEALRQADGNKSVAARLLGVHRKVVERRVRRNNA